MFGFCAFSMPGKRETLLSAHIMTMFGSVLIEIHLTLPRLWTTPKHTQKYRVSSTVDGGITLLDVGNAVGRRYL
jgi:hypothetical protein